MTDYAKGRFYIMKTQRLIIEGGHRLGGEIRLQGAKNSALPIIAAAALADGETVLSDCPRLTDIYSSARIMRSIGCVCTLSGNTLKIKNNGLAECTVSDELMSEMRSSILFLGALLGKCGKCRISFPGGCRIGARPVDIHLSAMRKMGAEISEEYGNLECRAEGGLKGTKIALPFASVGATENVMLAAVTAKGETEIINAAREPEIADLAKFLNKCGADIRGAGEGTIFIKGVKQLKGCEYSVMPDRIVCATYMSAAASSGGELNISNVRASDLDAVISVYEQMGCKIYTYNENLYINAPEKLKPVSTIRTMPYPAFPTDAQSLAMAVLCRAKGTSVIEENIFENRFAQAGELVRMGADIKVFGKTAVITGVHRLYGAKVSAADLRGGAALIIAGLSADGITEINELRYIDRGYEEIEKILSSVGARISRV